MANPFEAGEQKIIPAVLIYVKHQGRVLMIHRNGRSGDYHSGKWNGLGGKLELDESPLAAAKRELQEESGLDLPVENFKILGSLYFPNFKANKNEDWWVTVLVAHLDSKFPTPKLVPSDEGELHWIPAQDLLSLNLWAGDGHFIPNVISENPFMGTLWYKGQEVTRAEMTQLA
jgi:8-oxo-dGTP diphosphatase